MSKRSRRTALRNVQSARSESASDTPTLRAFSTPDLLGAIPAMFGFHPQRSLVALALTDKQVSFQLRSDLPALDCAEACADNLMPPLLRARPDDVVLVAYVDPQPGDGARGAGRSEADALVDAMRSRLGSENIYIRDAVCCDGSRYWSYLCDNAECCPPEGTPYAIDETATMAAAVFNGRQILPDRGALERRFEPVQGERRAQMEQATTRVVGEIAKAHGIFLGGQTLADQLHTGRSALLRAGAEYVEGLLSDLDTERAGTLDDDTAAALMVWSRLLPVRDLAWSFITDANAKDHLALWTEVARRAVPPFEPAPLCLAGFSAWLSGDGAQAACALGRVKEIAPDYSLGNLLYGLLERCVPPSAWREFDDETIRAQITPANDAW